MITTIFDRNYTKIIYITNNKYSKNLTVDIINKWKTENCRVELQILDLENNTISNFLDKNTIKQRKDCNYIMDTIDKYGVCSYPAFLIIKNNQLIESIYGSYDNILDILNIYF
jgi:hypothetical protein